MSVVDDVKARLDIVDVVSGYTNLHKAGRNFKGLCPFHQEKTPSFIVFPETQTWRCFGCNEGGDAFAFVMRAEGWDFKEALSELAQRVGVELVPQTPQQVAREAEIDRLYGLLAETSRFFYTQLLEAPGGAAARDYVAQRGLTADTIEAFTLGYAPDDWQQALNHLRQLGYTVDEIVEAGVATRNERGRVYDRFRDRLVIPIRDGRGRTLGFGARALQPDAVPKYLNSPQGPLFDKSHLLYGMDLARRAIRETETAVIVEGYMDVMQAHQAGFANVVAQMGTALTEPQLRQLDRYASRLILALDADAAGIKATMRGLNVARETLDGEQSVTFDPRGMMRYTGMLDMDMRVVSLPDGQDPDDLIRADPAAWEALIQRAVPVADYVIQQGTAHLPAGASYHEREQVARELLPILTATENDIQRNGNIQTLARRVHIDEKVLIQWTQRRKAAATRAVPTLRQQRRLASALPPQDAQVAPDSPRAPGISAGGPPGHSVRREADCLRLLIEQPEWVYAVNRVLRELQGDDDRLQGVLAPFGPEDFSRPDYQAIFRELSHCLDAADAEPLTYLYQVLPDELVVLVDELLTHSLDELEQALPPALATELKSVLREQDRVQSRREPDTGMLVQDALMLRHTRLERELRELYFLQQEATDEAEVAHFQATIDQHRYARQLIMLTIKRMWGLSRGG